MTRFASILTAAAASAAVLTLAGAAAAAPAKFYSAPGAAPTAPISAGAIVSAGSQIFFVSGIPGDAKVGNTEMQTTDSLTKLKAVLEANGYSMKDVANAKVYLVGDPAMGGKMDFPGMNKAFAAAFGATKPSRVTVQIAALAGAGSLVEIELVAVK